MESSSKAGSAYQVDEELTEQERKQIEANKQKALKRRRERSEALNEVLGSYGLSNTDADGLTKKKIKTAQETEDTKFMKDAQKVASKGSVVRVQGTKLIDTGGGFFLEEKDLEQPDTSIEETPAKIVEERSHPFAEDEAPLCLDCQRKFPESFLQRTFDYPVCDSCRDSEEKHKYITRTDAKAEFILKDVDLDKREPILKYILRPNPHNSRWGDMKLYLRIQVEEKAIGIWGSLENIKNELEAREQKKISSKIKKHNKKMDTLRRAARSSMYTRDLSNHQHRWGEETYIEETDSYSHTCVECSFTEHYEKM